MSLQVSDELLAAARSGNLSGQMFLECVRESLPHAWEALHQLAHTAAEPGYAVQSLEDFPEATQGELLRLLASTAMREQVARSYSGSQCIGFLSMVALTVIRGQVGIFLHTREGRRVYRERLGTKASWEDLTREVPRALEILEGTASDEGDGWRITNPRTLFDPTRRELLRIHADTWLREGYEAVKVRTLCFVNCHRSGEFDGTKPPGIARMAEFTSPAFQILSQSPTAVHC